MGWPHWSERDPRVLEAELRVGTWLQAVMPYGGNVGFWWWLYLDATDDWDRYAAVAAFMRDEDPRGRDVRPRRFDISSNEAFAAGSSGHGQHRLYVWQRGIGRRPWDGTSRPAGTLVIPENPPGSQWRLQIHDGETGSVQTEHVIIADENGALTIELPMLAPDIALKLIW